jgi:hypothetical protein
MSTLAGSATKPAVPVGWGADATGSTTAASTTSPTVYATGAARTALRSLLPTNHSRAMPRIA